MSPTLQEAIKALKPYLGKVPTVKPTNIMGLLQNTIFRHPERSEGSYQRRDSSAFGLRMTAQTEFRNNPIIAPKLEKLFSISS